MPSSPSSGGDGQYRRGRGDFAPISRASNPAGEDHASEFQTESIFAARPPLPAACKKRKSQRADKKRSAVSVRRSREAGRETAKSERCDAGRDSSRPTSHKSKFRNW